MSKSILHGRKIRMANDGTSPNVLGKLKNVPICDLCCFCYFDPTVLI